MARYRRMDHDENPLSPILDRFTTEQLRVLYRKIKDKRGGVRPFFGSVKGTIAFRDYLLERLAFVNDPTGQVVLDKLKVLKNDEIDFDLSELSVDVSIGG